MANDMHVVCDQCGATNRVPADRMGQGPVCGRCKAPVLPAKPLEVGAASFEKMMAKEDLPILVDFWASWCGPCKMMAPAYEQAAAALHPRVRLVKVSTEQEQALAARYGIQSIPTMVLFKGGREVDRLSGAMPAEQIVQWVNSRV